MGQYYGMTAEMYKAVVALVDDRMQTIQVMRQDYDQSAAAHSRLESRMDRVEAALERLVEAQARTEKRLDRLEATVQKLAEAQARTEKRVEELAEAQARTEKRLDDLIQVVGGIQDTLGAVKGRQLELTYKERVGTYFGPLMRRVHVVSPIEIEDDLETHLTEEEFRDLLLLDLLVTGKPRSVQDAPQVWLAVEISGVIDRHDVERAQRRARHLSKAGYMALPAVAGEHITKGAEEIVQKEGVLMILDGWTSSGEQVLEQALAAK